MRQATETSSDISDWRFYSGHMAEAAAQQDEGDDTFARWLRKTRLDAGWPKIAATQALAEVGIKERTYFRWESGEIAKPDPREVRKACLRLGFDTREAAIALGIVTRQELTLPRQDALHPKLRGAVTLLRDDRLPQEMGEWLLDLIDSAAQFCYKQLGVRRPPAEPSAEERAKNKAVTRR
jgi:hypothetical protein